MKEKAIRSMCVVTIICASASVAIAGLPDGYVWGLANCGPSVETTETACNLCCEHAGQNGTITPGEVSGCKQMCQESVFTQPTWWGNFLVWVFG